MSTVKTTKMTNDEKRFVLQHKDVMTVQEIAKELNRSASQIYRVMQTLSVKAGETIDVLDDRSAIVAQLKKKNFFKLLGSQLTPQEIKFFVEEWASTIQQFSGDLLPTEESELKDLIITDIMKNRLLAENKDLIDKRVLMEVELKAPATAANPRKVGELKHELASSWGIIKENMKNLKDLTERATKLRDSLSASRRQRVDAISNAKIDITHFLKLLQDRETRDKVGREMELLKKAKNKALKKYSEPIAYNDGQIDNPVLTHLTDDLIDEVENESE